MFEKLAVRFNRYRRVRLTRRIRRLKIMSHHPSFKVPLATFGVLLLVTAVGYGLARGTHHITPRTDNRIVIISHDHEQQVVPSKEATVGMLLQKLHLTLNQGDVVEPAPTTVIDQDQFRINIYRAVPVQVIDMSGQSSFTFSAAKTPRSIAQQAGENLFPEDTVTTNPVQNFVKTGSVGEQIVIDRATPVNVDLYGTPVVLRTHAKTVAGMMREKHIVLTKEDRLSVPPDTPITPNVQIGFLRTGSKTVTATEQIATPVQTIDDPTLAYGTSAVRQQGSPGVQVVTYQVQLVNNVETGRTIIQKVVTKAPVTQVSVIGTSLSGIKGDMALAGIAPSDYNYADYIISHESGWCPTKAQGQYGGCPAYAGSVPSYGGYGLCQSTPGSKMATAGSDWATNPVTQLRWCSGYAQRYGGWYGSYQHWVANHNW